MSAAPHAPQHGGAWASAARWDGLRLLVDVSRKRPGFEPEPIRLGDRLHADLIREVGPWRGTIVSVHGMSPVGQRDPRLQVFHGALARRGFRVVAPHLPGVTRLRIHAGQIDAIEHALHAVATTPILAPTGTVGAFAVSFSAGLTLLAAARPRVARHVQAACLLGGYHDVRSLLRFLLTAPQASRFAAAIALASFLEHVRGPQPALAEALRVFAQDTWWKRTTPQLPEVLTMLPTQVAEEARALLQDDPTARQRVLDEILAADPLFLDLGSCEGQLGHLRARLTLLHGEGDDVIPAMQSRQLARSLSDVGHPVRLCVTPLLSHGDTQGGLLRTARAAGPLADAFGGFLADVAAPAAAYSGSGRVWPSATSTTAS